MRKMTWASACALRLTRHYLAGTGSVTDAAGAVCGIHAQVMTAAELSLGIRTGVPATGIREALWTDRSLWALGSYPQEGRILTLRCHPRELLFSGKAAQRALSGGQAGNVAVMLLDGTVVGIWHQNKTGKKLVITAEPFIKLTASLRRQLESEVDRVGSLVQALPALIVGEVTARAHL